MKPLVWLWLLSWPLRSLAELPVVELSVPKESDPKLPLVFFYSGDGGWAEFDQEVTRRLHDAGWPVVGVNSLKYFWSRRTPEETAADLGKAIDHYCSTWQRERVVLVGFSQGADALPFAVNRLTDTARAHVALLVLIGPGNTTSFKVKISTWLGAKPAADDPALKPEVLRLAPLPILAVTGERDPDAAKDWPVSDGLQSVLHSGDHHLDKDFDGITQLILKRWDVLTK